MGKLRALISEVLERRTKYVWYTDSADQSANMRGFCQNCKCVHDIPRNQWALIMRKGGKHVRLACVDSVRGGCK